MNSRCCLRSRTRGWCGFAPALVFSSEAARFNYVNKAVSLANKHELVHTEILKLLTNCSCNVVSQTTCLLSILSDGIQLHAQVSLRSLELGLNSASDA
eukprot:m.355375 g.355375  ORF g.355375 m.355375 type:complete len:98 (+) comp17239_c0_seq1:866-1159(+)